MKKGFKAVAGAMTLTMAVAAASDVAERFAADPGSVPESANFALAGVPFVTVPLKPSAAPRAGHRHCRPRLPEET